MWCYYATLEKLCNVQEDILIYIHEMCMCVRVRVRIYLLRAVDNLDYVVDTCDTSLCNASETKIGPKSTVNGVAGIRIIIKFDLSLSRCRFIHHLRRRFCCLRTEQSTIFVNAILLYYVILFCAEIFFHCRWRFLAI